GAKSYSNVLTGSLTQPRTSSQSWICVGEKDIVSSISNDVRSLKLSKEFKEKLCQPWSNTADKDYFKALTGGPWMILDHYLIVQQWNPSFRVSNKLPSKMVVWVRFPHMPIQLYHKEVLISLDNLVGKTIKIDYNTQSAERGKFARIAVEIDLSEALVPGIDLDGAWQRIEYENLPNLCFECGKVGHLLDSCPTSSAPCGMEGLVVFGT
ncbi:hypothetical protein LINPERPRIM_LOCUS38538, partial [Linum perenne]